MFESITTDTWLIVLSLGMLGWVTQHGMEKVVEAVQDVRDVLQDRMPEPPPDWNEHDDE